MNEFIAIAIAAIFMPLFPASMIFTWLFDRIENSYVRMLMLLLWPLVGVFIASKFIAVVPAWVMWLSLVTSLLYALRVLTLREVNQWAGFVAVSLWSLLWLSQTHTESIVYAYALSKSIPLLLLVSLAAGLQQRFGAAYTELYGGLARTVPRFSGVLIMVVVATIATPVFPTFFIMLDMITRSVSSQPLVVVILLLTWLLWSWAGARLIQGLIVGREHDAIIEDFSIKTVSLYMLSLLALALSGLYLGGVVL